MPGIPRLIDMAFSACVIETPGVRSSGGAGGEGAQAPATARWRPNPVPWGAPEATGGKLSSTGLCVWVAATTGQASTRMDGNAPHEGL